MTRRTVLEFAIFFYIIATLLSLYLIYDAYNEGTPMWMTSAGVTGAFIFFTVLLICITITHFMYVTISCDAMNNVATVARNRLLIRSEDYFIGTMLLSGIVRFETRSRWVGGDAPRMEHSLMLFRNNGYLLRVFSGGERAVQFLADKLNAWLQNSR